MEESGLKTVVRDNLPWIGVFVLVVLAAVYAYHREKAAPASETKPVSKNLPQSTASPTSTGPEPSVSYEAPQLHPARNVQEDVRKTIAEYNERVRTNPKDPDAPAYYSAMGNLTFVQLGDAAEAARYYEVLLSQYPQWDGIMHVYTQLMACYEKLNDRRNLEFTYKRMMEYFPPDSPQHQYAKLHLGL